jgi:hypothetical protein
MAAGMSKQATTINPNQMFSHFHRSSIFIGAVKETVADPGKRGEEDSGEDHLLNQKRVARTSY